MTEYGWTDRQKVEDSSCYKIVMEGGYTFLIPKSKGGSITNMVYHISEGNEHEFCIISHLSGEALINVRKIIYADVPIGLAANFRGARGPHTFFGKFQKVKE